MFRTVTDENGNGVDANTVMKDGEGNNADITWKSVQKGVKLSQRQAKRARNQNVGSKYFHNDDSEEEEDTVSEDTIEEKDKFDDLFN